MLWLWGCETNEIGYKKEEFQSIDVFVEQKVVATGMPIILSVEVYQEYGWRHDPLHISSASLDVQWKKTETEEIGKGLRSIYTYHLLGRPGSHIIDAIILVGMGPNGKEEVSSPEVFVDIGEQRKPSTLKGIEEREDASLFWPVILTGSVGAFALWYMKRRKKIPQVYVSLEEQYRSKWNQLIQEECDIQERAIRLSFLLRSYLFERFSLDLLHSTPQEAMEIVHKQKWPAPVRDAVTQIFCETDEIRFAGKKTDEEGFASMGRCLEVIFSVGNPS